MIKIENNQSIEVAIPESGVHLDLVITDRETVIELFKHEEESARNEFVRSALKVGVLAIRQACGVVDAQSIQMECQKFMDVVEESLTGHAEKMSGQVEKLLGKYFDPSSGEFNQRLDRLVKKDGELEVLLGKHLNGDGSSLTTTLEKHIGQNSPLLQMLSPDQKKGILAAIDENTDYGIHIQDEVKAGVWAPSNKPNLIKEKIDLLRSNPQLCKEMGENGYRYFVNHVTPKHSYELVMSQVKRAK